jgi:putative Mn2+ efflux pump MntP
VHWEITNGRYTKGMEGQGFNARTLIIVFGLLGFVGLAWIGSKIGHETIFLGLWSGMLGALGAIVGILFGNFLSKHL